MLIFFLRHSNFCPDLLITQENGLRRKLRLFERVTSSTGKQIIAIQILPIISRTKGSQIMKFRQLIEYNIRNISFQMRYAKCVEKLVPDLFLKNQTRAYHWINSLKHFTVCFYCMPELRTTKNIKFQVLITWFYLIQSLFKNQKQV